VASTLEEIERVRWRCRRGMLELDIVLARFVGNHYAALDEVGRRAFDALLDMPDAELWDMITGKRNMPQADSRHAVLELIRAA
jgi:antitoxin CptB